jgi:hypothetical protein
MRGSYLLAVLPVALFAVGCGGENLFVGPGKGTPGPGDAPTIVSVTGATEVVSGQMMDIRVHARGARPITHFVIRIRGATVAESDSNVAVSPALTDVTRDISIFVTGSPGPFRIEIIAVDDAAAPSDIHVWNATVVAGP